MIVGASVLVSAAFFPPGFAHPTRWFLPIAGLYVLQSAFGMLHYSKRGKLKLRDTLLSSIEWRGDEDVLDVGCGRGLLLIGAAKRLVGGRATGVDIWVRGAVTGNHPDTVLENAMAERVADRVTIVNGDARHLPFAAAVFDVVTSNFVLHEVKTWAEREAIVREIVRVLKPGGRFMLADFIFTRECTEIFRRAGALNARRIRIGRFRFWIGAVLSLGVSQLYQIAGSRDGPRAE